ncbi:hypothetical protein O181_002007 [Austropuccinia psidii MF-1]|uniref:Uncharacterized protein n=1 Tax=Austropuccinia psidii MF-1 TaxID=1389203 RepID=A0A9Q3BBN8_9BASI|nr:hypothetical protein [Austropuccinia psidii MF-1]
MSKNVDIPVNVLVNSPTDTFDDSIVELGSVEVNFPEILFNNTQRNQLDPLGLQDSVSKLPLNSFSSNKQYWNFANNMNQNLKNMLSPLMMLIQNRQEQAEEKDRMQRDQEKELRLKEEEREEEKRLLEAKLWAEEKSRNNWLDMVMLMILEKIS